MDPRFLMWFRSTVPYNGGLDPAGTRRKFVSLKLECRQSAFKSQGQIGTHLAFTFLGPVNQTMMPRVMTSSTSYLRVEATASISSVTLRKGMPCSLTVALSSVTLRKDNEKQVGQPGRGNTDGAGKGLRCQGGRREARRRGGGQRATMHVGQSTTGLRECDQGVSGGAVWCCSHGSRGAVCYREETRRRGGEKTEGLRAIGRRRGEGRRRRGDEETTRGQTTREGDDEGRSQGGEGTGRRGDEEGGRRRGEETTRAGDEEGSRLGGEEGRRRGREETMRGGDGGATLQGAAEDSYGGYDVGGAV